MLRCCTQVRHITSLDGAGNGKRHIPCFFAVLLSFGAHYFCDVHVPQPCSESDSIEANAGRGRICQSRERAAIRIQVWRRESVSCGQRLRSGRGRITRDSPAGPPIPPIAFGCGGYCGTPGVVRDRKCVVVVRWRRQEGGAGRQDWGSRCGTRVQRRELGWPSPVLQRGQLLEASCHSFPVPCRKPVR